MGDEGLSEGRRKAGERAGETAGETAGGRAATNLEGLEGCGALRSIQNCGECYGTYGATVRFDRVMDGVNDTTACIPSRLRARSSLTSTCLLEWARTPMP
jgi:hypothetical protein